MFYEGIFQPSGKMQYNIEDQRLAGKKVAVQDGWIRKEEPYKGQQCFYIPNSTVGWIPISDLKELKPISLVKLKEINNLLGLQ